MARFNDNGPYSKNNVKIILNGENVSEACKGKPSWNSGKTGYLSKESLDNIRKAQLGNNNQKYRKTFGNRFVRGIPKKDS